MTRSTELAAVTRALEEDIVLGRLHPRERLPEDALIARFGAKRHVIRDALRRLAEIGVVELIPNRGAQVRAFTPAEVRDLYDLREMLETGAAARLPAPLPASALAALEAAQRRHDAAVEAGDKAAIFRANRAFHARLFSFCPNPFLVEAVEAASRRAHAIRFASLGDPAAVARARDEHHAMIAAAAEGRRDDLVNLCRAHLPASREAYLACAVTP
ncbi:GntR family transcriptional regulator [Amaricoccus solimangrovi]|uniref:GntR family transcriptional regulator n=1 Tax=Amaricoccus solimangrovi TaxID=2589815 RepID=A0A501WLF7_9RHOB|nr:GntR family transcriptional regulator [Amaricoccus solimangrovi]TPE48974.1 GntR family transcriptional regulator [Amaricoccus solimangrovi]